MKLTPELKKEIDSKSHYELLKHWRFAPAGDLLMQGESGAYWGKRMDEKKYENLTLAIKNSKSLSEERG